MDALSLLSLSPLLLDVNQLRIMDMGLSQFMHFSVDPFTSIEHNCVGTDGNCVPASIFNPSNLSTDQWVEAAVAMGAGEICLTAHHEGGFCLWDTKYSNYSVMHSNMAHQMLLLGMKIPILRKQDNYGQVSIQLHLTWMNCHQEISSLPNQPPCTYP